MRQTLVAGATVGTLVKVASPDGLTYCGNKLLAQWVVADPKQQPSLVVEHETLQRRPAIGQLMKPRELGFGGFVIRLQDKDVGRVDQKLRTCLMRCHVLGETRGAQNAPRTVIDLAINEVDQVAVGLWP